MITIRLLDRDLVKLHYVESAVKLQDVLNELNISHDMPCSGQHTCGKCKIKVKGHLSKLSDKERTLLTQEELDNHIRLACFVEVLGDAEVILSDNDLTVLSVKEPRESNYKNTGYGIAVDVGTTTIAMQLYDLATGQLLSESVGINEQVAFGADVISRIQYTIENGNASVKEVLYNQLLIMADKCMHESGVKKIDKWVVTGNTVMLHFYEGLETESISRAPFTPKSLFGRESSIGLNGEKPYLPECIGSYIGADITCAILASEIHKHSNKIELLADLGTNGELVLNNKGRLLCASTALGPAFEGANLTYGMRATKGAISKIRVEDNMLKMETVDNSEPKGICGSGVLDAVRLMLEEEIMDETGRLDEEYSAFGQVVSRHDGLAWQLPNTTIMVTQKDIRQVQLAKSAVFAGIKTLLKEADLQISDIDKFYVAGGFGYYMNAESATIIGLFPKGLENKIELIGNGALSGAISLLMNANEMKNERAIISKSTEIHLSGKKTFSDYYIDGMLFGDE